MRIFLAVFPSHQAQDEAARVIERLRSPGDGVSWVKRDNLHYTLRFMGELGESGLARVIEAARDGVVGHSAFPATLGAAGAFPSPRRARVLWVGLSQGADALGRLARSVERTLRQRGFDAADRAFSSHLTLGRVRQRDQDWSGRLAGVSIEGAPHFTVDRVTVIQSTLSPKGSIYETKAEAMLAG